MRQTITIMKVSLRVLTALSKKRQPDSADVETLRRYLGSRGPFDLDELCCDVIQKALSVVRAEVHHR